MDLARKACQDGCIAHATLELWVNKQFKFIASKALLTLYAKAEVVPVGCREYNICLEDKTSIYVADLVVELPDCVHTFHRKCITKWFARRSTYPLCRRDLSMYLGSAVQRFLSHFTEEDD